MPLICPRCRSPIEEPPSDAKAEVVCPSCGSSFRPDGDATITAVSPDGPIALGRFELIEAVGSGGFGTVYKARDPQLDRTGALKVPRAGLLAGRDDLERFLREARSVARLRHPAIVPVHEVGQVDGVPYLVHEFAQGL